MKKAPLIANERERLAELLSYEILDTPLEPHFDDFTELASLICKVPIALISLVDEDRQWFKSKIGIPAPETPRDISFCGHAIAGNEVFVVEDVHKDERFFDNPLVSDAPHIRFYAGAPLITPSGHGIGTLCIIDKTPRKLSFHEKLTLEVLSRQIITQLELQKSFRRSQADLAELKRLTQLVNLQNAKLYHSSKLASLGEMAAGIAHEINNPLTIIVTKAEALKNQYERGAPFTNLDQDVSKIEKAAERISRITTSMRSLARNSADDPFETVSLSGVLSETLSLCEEKLKNNGVILKISNLQEINVEGNFTQLSQVLLNLLINAYHAVEKAVEKWIEIEVTQTADVALIKVTDSGEGIPDEIKEKIMEPFFTTKKVGHGTGLGLSISQSIIESHRGKLFLEDDYAHTRFCIQLPLR